MSLRILVLAPDCNPDGITNPAIAFYHAEALTRLHQVTLVLYASNEDSVRRRGVSFHAIEPIHVPMLDQLYDWSLKRIFKYDYGRMTVTASSYPRHIFFEVCAWRRLRKRIFSGSFDVVLRISPYNRVFPSPFAWFLRNGPAPFVVGPITGGLPWTKGFPQLEQQQRASGWWIWNLRGVADHVPFARSTYSKATAIIAASSHTYSELAAHREKLFFMPTEIGVNPALFESRADRRASDGRKLQLMFVGRLIPFKACDMAIRGAARFLRAGVAHFTVVGDGAERGNLERLAQSLGVEEAVSFVGWLPQEGTLKLLQNADVLVFPSLREIGGGVVFEALAAGAVPVVADFGGPGDVVTPDVGYKIAMTNERDMVSQIESVLSELADDRKHLEDLRERGMAYARGKLTYDARVRVITEILMWAIGRGPKPDLKPPGRVHAASA